MDPFTISMLAGAGLGGIKAIAGAKAKREAKQRLADEILYSPWSGMVPSTQIPETNAIGDIAGGALAGASFGQNLEASQIANANLRAGGMPSSSPAAIDAQVQTLPARTSAWEGGVRNRSSLLGPQKQRAYSLWGN